MSTLTEALKNTRRAEWAFVVIVILSSIFLRCISLPFGDVFFYGVVSIYCVYTSFFKEQNLPIKNRLVGAFFRGAFIVMFIEALAKVFAKWAVWRFF